MITGQRVSIERGQNQPTLEGLLVAYVLGVGIGEGSVETRERIVVQTDAGRIVFADPRLIHVLSESAQPAQQGTLGTVADAKKVTTSGPKCPVHKIAVPSKKKGVTFYCPGKTGDVYCDWTHPPAAERKAL